jgi:hypothetical protein
MYGARLNTANTANNNSLEALFNGTAPSCTLRAARIQYRDTLS